MQLRPCTVHSFRVASNATDMAMDAFYIYWGFSFMIHHPLIIHPIPFFYLFYEGSTYTLPVRRLRLSTRRRSTIRTPPDSISISIHPSNNNVRLFTHSFAHSLDHVSLACYLIYI